MRRQLVIVARLRRRAATAAALKRSYYSCCAKATLAPQLQDARSSSSTALEVARSLFLELVVAREKEFISVLRLQWLLTYVAYERGRNIHNYTYVSVVSLVYILVHVSRTHIN